ncbi:MAG: HD-GYP domain-containing protein [Gemmatimonadales bacterium]
MRIASAIGLGADERLALFYALLLKDAGCSSNSARLAELFGNDDRALKRDVKNSEGVAAIAVQLAEGLGMPAAERRELRRAALLHDIGKLGVSNAILDKPGKLDDAEWAAMRRHPAYTFEILDRVKRFQPLAEMAASHHERMDGNGYHRELTAERLSRPARILAVADVTEALLADRPYRKGLGWDRVLSIVGEMAGPVLCPECCEVLKDGDPPSAARD